VLSECQELPDGPLVANVSHHPLVPRQVNNAAELLGSEEHFSEEAEPSKREDIDTPDQSGSENSPLASEELSRALSAEDLAFFEGDLGHLYEGLPSDGHLLREGPEVMEASPQGDQSPLIAHDKRTNEQPESPIQSTQLRAVMSLHEAERKRLDEEWRIEREKRSSDRLFEQRLLESKQRFEETRAQIEGEGSSSLESLSPLSSVGLSQRNKRVVSWVQNSAAHSQIERGGSPPGPRQVR
jgi:hypothetical protein